MELGKTPVEKHEHVLVGLSSSPSNRKIIEEASKLAKAFDAEFTALYVSKSQEITLPPEDAVRLQNNIRYAEDLDDRRIDFYAAETIRRGVLERLFHRPHVHFQH